VTSEGLTADVFHAGTDQRHDSDAPLFCYRHPDRETRVRCGRCEQPICTRCAMQGPVGFRCKKCGTLAHDPMTSLRPMQAALGLLVAAGLGAVVGFLAGQIGLIGIFIGFIAGGLIAEAVMRVVGYKRGPYIVAVVVGGIVAGVLIGYGFGFWTQWASLLSDPELAAEMADAGMSAFSLFLSELAWPLIAMAATAAGAYTRLR
jgi:hypothetical protein